MKEDGIVIATSVSHPSGHADFYLRKRQQVVQRRVSVGLCLELVVLYSTAATRKKRQKLGGRCVEVTHHDNSSVDALFGFEFLHSFADSFERAYALCGARLEGV